MHLEIGPTDIGDLEVRIPASSNPVTGRVSLAGGRPPSEADPPFEPLSGGRDEPLPPGPRVVFSPTAPGQASVAVRAALRDGRFEVSGPLAGTYRLDVADLPEGYYLERVSLNGSPLGGRLVNLRPDAASSIDLVLGEGSATIAGVVLDRDGTAIAGATGYLLPDPLPERIGYHEIFVSGEDGAFEISHVPPGRYRVPAVGPEAATARTFPSPEVLRRAHAAARTIIVDPGSRTTLTTERTRIE
jgi:hypothetical protein